MEKFLIDNWHFIAIVGAMLTIMLRLISLFFSSQQRKIEVLEKELREFRELYNKDVLELKSGKELRDFKDAYNRDFSELKTSYEFFKEHETFLKMMVTQVQNVITNWTEKFDEEHKGKLK